MKRFVLILVGCLVMIFCVCIEASAEIMFSEEAEAVFLADKALEEKYGITLTMQTFFVRTESKQNDNSILIKYTGTENLSFVLGEYDAIIREGQVDISWSHDGESTENGFQSVAWGWEQIQNMIQHSGDSNLLTYYSYADAITANIQMGQETIEQPNVVSEMDDEDWEQLISDIKNKQNISIETMCERASYSIISVYNLNENQGRMLLIDNLEPHEDPDDSWMYCLINNKPCYCVCVMLIQKPVSDDPFCSLEWTEKDGTYRVYINVETGVIERMFYDSGLGGIG